jgi:hypothetical protein
MTTTKNGRKRTPRDGLTAAEREQGRREARRKERMSKIRSDVRTIKERKRTGKKEVIERGDGTQIIYQEGFPRIFVDRSGKGRVTLGTSTVALLKGEEDVATWTDEELIRGAPMRITKVPRIIPFQVYQELVNRMMAKARYTFVAELEYTVQKHMEIIKKTNPKDPTPTQWNAIRELYDRVLGKAEQTVKIGVDMDNPFMKMVASAIVGNEEQAKEFIDVKALPDGDAG